MIKTINSSLVNYFLINFLVFKISEKSEKILSEIP